MAHQPRQTTGPATVTAAAQVAVLEGTATYRERIALPPGAVFEASIQDVAIADAPATLLARTTFEPQGQVPIRFRIEYDPGKLDPRARYSLSARITVDGKLRWITDRHYPAFVDGKPQGDTLILRAVGSAEPVDAPLGALPAAFEGVLPCADCEGIRHHLDLYPDGVFFLRQTWLGKSPERGQDDIGTWRLASDGRTLLLAGGREAVQRWAIVDGGTLRQLDLEGQPIESPLNYNLRRRAPPFGPLQPRLLLRGAYFYMADAATFTECLTGRRMPVAMEGESIALERAYSAAGGSQKGSMLATLEGRIDQRPPMEGDGLEPTVIVERFVRLSPGETCPARFDNAPLAGTYWKATQLLGDAVAAPGSEGAPRQQAHLRFDAAEGRVGGTGGCNRMIGGYKTEGDSIEFTRMASTMMACPDGGMEGDRRLASALEAARRWLVAGPVLELFDAAGTRVARFEATAEPGPPGGGAKPQ